MPLTCPTCDRPPLPAGNIQAVLPKLRSMHSILTPCTPAPLLCPIWPTHLCNRSGVLDNRSLYSQASMNMRDASTYMLSEFIVQGPEPRMLSPARFLLCASPMSRSMATSDKLLSGILLGLSIVYICQGATESSRLAIVSSAPSSLKTAGGRMLS